MKSLLSSFFVLSFASLALAQTPVINKPHELMQGEFSEGTQGQVSAKDIQSLLSWGESAKNN